MMKANITSITSIKVDLVSTISCFEGDIANNLGNNFQNYEGREDHWEWYEADSGIGLKENLKNMELFILEHRRLVGNLICV